MPFGTSCLPKKIFFAALSARATFFVTETVHYECIKKPRKNISKEQTELIDRYRNAIKSGQFQVKSFDIEDLIEIGTGAPASLSAGELSCIAVAKKIESTSFMTDEKKANDYAKRIGIITETTPKLYAWLQYKGLLSDGDHNAVISEHEKYERRPLTTFFNEAYQEAMRARMMDNK